MPFVVGRRIVVSQSAVLEAAMVSWLEELERREAAAREKIGELRTRIEELDGHLAEREMVLSRLEITRETMTEILYGDETVSGPGSRAEPEAGGPVEVSRPEAGEDCPFGMGSPVGVRLVPPWTPELAVGVLPRSYQDIVEVLADAVRPMRAHHICAALGLSTDKCKVEGFRSKLKRLVERGWLTEAEPGLFAPRPAVTAHAHAPEEGRTEASRRRAGVGSGSRP
ncbi:hypothetical protein AS594_35650 [Streptomyces agglomeratus]|uniref:Uncharacterized protein n=1 Tax=Streptomyces agglomeratus TaxID=285458 RepID=A0A1E5PHG5_9ACTN|nr:hypothetical protein AS594_35650 [Streptomyces agglomeratus]